MTGASETDLEVVRSLSRAASASLEASRRRIDDLNVYPVPDGDTGTNMALTVRAVVEALEAARPATRLELAARVTRAALMGARGNSGVILSQIVRGAAEVLGASGRVSAATLACALRSASDAAYRAVREPVEGTILTVVRELAEEAEARAADDPKPVKFLRAIVERGERSVAGTREKLDVLRRAGVVDAGGAGLLELLRGIAAEQAGEPLPEPPAAKFLIGHDAVHQELSRYRYCTVFVVEGEDLDADALEAGLARLGDSLLVVGDVQALKIHVHTDEPGSAIGLGTAVGVVEGVEIANMHAQTLEREERVADELGERTTQACELVAAVAGKGNKEIFESLGATRIVEGGQTMNPAAAQFVEAIEAVAADEVVLLPNNANVILTARQAADLAAKRVEVVPTDSIQQGIAAMVAFDGAASAAENAASMRDAIASVATGEVTVASRDADVDGLTVRAGAFLGLVDGKAVCSSASFDEVAIAVVDDLLCRPRHLVTLLLGEDEEPLAGLRAHLAERHPDVEVDVHAGGQPHYPLLVSAE